MKYGDAVAFTHLADLLPLLCKNTNFGLSKRQQGPPVGDVVDVSHHLSPWTDKNSEAKGLVLGNTRPSPPVTQACPETPKRPGYGSRSSNESKIEPLSLIKETPHKAGENWRGITPRGNRGTSAAFLKTRDRGERSPGPMILAGLRFRGH